MGKNNRKRRAQKKRKKSLRKKELNKKRIKDANRPISPVFHTMQNPFSGLTDAERKQAIQGLAQNSEKAFQESLSKIKDIIYRYDSVPLLAILATYGLTVGVGDNGVQKTKDSDFNIHQSHLEIFQALALQPKPNELQRLPFSPDVVQEVWDTLIKLMQAYSYMDLEQITKHELDEEKAVTLLQQQMRGNTQMVRNWGYFSQVKSISQEIYGCFDRLLEETYGFSASNLIDLFQLLIDKIETANSDRLQSLSTLHNSKDKTELVFKYHELIGEPADKAEQFIQGIDIESIPFKSLFAMTVSHYDLRLTEIYEFSPKYLAGKLGIDESVIRKMIDKFGYERGDLESYESEYLYLSNPVWFRPIIKIENDKYFCVFPQVFFSFILQSLNSLVEKIDKKALTEICDYFRLNLGKWAIFKNAG